MARRVSRLLLSSVVVGSLAGSLTGCSSDSTGIEIPVNSFAYSNAAIMAVAIATAHKGAGPFDNAIACPRRGVVEYYDDASGRRARFNGCDTGNNVVIDGDSYIQGKLDEAGTNQTITSSGGLTVRVNGLASTVSAFTVAKIAFSAGTTPLATRLKATDMRITSGGVEITLDSRTSPTIVLAPTDITLGRLPNASNSVDALTAADMRQLVMRDLMLLGNLLLNESAEAARGAHQHTLSCGTTDVAPESGKPVGYVKLSNNWNSCVVEPGVLVNGTFQQAWDTFLSTTITMRVTGPVTFGGGIPTTTFSSIVWTITPPTTFPGNMDVSGTLTAGGTSRTFSFTAFVDD